MDPFYTQTCPVLGIPTKNHGLGTYKNVAFAGTAKFNGETFCRTDVETAAVKAGFIVRDKVDGSIDIMVSSSPGTRKAQAAKNFGILTIGYQEFSELLDMLKSPVLKKGQLLEEDQIPDFTRMFFDDFL